MSWSQTRYKLKALSSTGRVAAKRTIPDPNICKLYHCKKSVQYCHFIVCSSLGAVIAHNFGPFLINFILHVSCKVDTSFLAVIS